MLINKNMENWTLPVYNSIKDYLDLNPTVFHMPGHKMGKGIPTKFLDNISLMDLTEIPGLDNLQQPDSSIKLALELAAKTFGANQSFFLVNGATSGILSMILAITKPKDKLIVARDCHKSIVNALMLAQVEPLFIFPEINKEFGITTIIEPNKIKKVLDQNPDAVGVVITRPTYYGICSDIEEIANIVHSKNKILAVDEAHGAHLKFSDRFPICAMDAGADICVQSAHKTLPALTQSGYLHVKSNRIDIQKLKNCLNIFQTTSPSYILIAFLDIARAIMQHEGKKRLNELIIHLENLKKNIFNFTKFIYASESNLSCRLDYTRVVINVKNTGYTGFEIEKILRNTYGVQVEMSDLFNITCISTIADTKQDFSKLTDSLTDLHKNLSLNNKFDDIILEVFDDTIKKMDLKSAFYSKYKRVPLNKSCGEVSKNAIMTYPPGIPLILPGEVIRESTIEYINTIINIGGNVVGLTNNEIEVVC